MSHKLPQLLMMALFASACAPSGDGGSTPPPPPAPTSGMATPPAGPATPPTGDDAMIKSAMSAAPDQIGKDATVLTVDDKGNMKTLRAGTNGWTCLPDMPSSPGADPMCVDKNGSEWMNALMAHKDPPKDKMGFGYMLAGGSDASNDDPYAAAPAAGGKWVTTGPHVMVLNPGAHFDGYPTTADDPTKPYVMFSKTPYAHLMVPVK